jgi:hypothetical protein
VQHAFGAVVAPAPAREDAGTAWTGFGKAKAAPPPAPDKPAAKAAAPPAPDQAGPTPPPKAAPKAEEADPGRGAEPDKPTKEADAPPPLPPPPPAADIHPESAGPSADASAVDDTGVISTRPLADPDSAALVLALTDRATVAKPDPPAEEVLPQRIPDRVAAVSRTRSTRRVQPGDLVCGQCGEGNPPTRKFCSRCGESLTIAEVVRPRWYRRLLFWRRAPKTLEAGVRTGQKGAPSSRRAALGQTYRRVRTAIAGLMLLATLLYVVVPPLRTPVDRLLEPSVSGVKNWVGRSWHKLTANTVTLPPNEVRASAELRLHKASAAFDDNINSFWAAPWAAKKPPSLTIHYDSAVDLVAYAVHAGAPGEDDSTFLHPRQLVIQYGSGRTDTIDLTASGDAQTGSLDQATSFRFARITITKVYVEDGLENVALSEIELKQRK